MGEDDLDSDKEDVEGNECYSIVQFMIYKKNLKVLTLSKKLRRLEFYKFKARRGSGFDEIFCIFANMSCLCIHLVTLFNLPCKKKKFMELFFLCRKISFFHHPKVFISVK